MTNGHCVRIYRVLVEVNGVQMAYSDTATGSPAVLLVHGFPLNRSMWDPQMGRLRAAGLRVIAPDLRGFGASEAGPPGPLTMDQHADDLAALLDACRVTDPVIVVGLSMGGYVAFAFWRRHASRVRGLALLVTRASSDTPLAVADRHRIAAEVEASSSLQPVIDAMRPRLFSPHLPRGSRVEQQVLGMLASSSVRAVADGERGLALRPSSLPTLPSISVPTLVLCGEFDALTPPADSEVIASGIPGAELVSVDGAGHMSNMENPEAVNEALLNWLEAVQK
ncbi:MAG: alpha/beta hydrolase [Chloroflexi bacterium]|nr:alpha/beta hydrolase [Chloroflexota bacterium]